jgi:decaprenylphospho-beta-D-erythro-pentofuranosid-2-ulose 2-reductase
MNDQQHIVIIGATSAIAEHCARIWLQEKPAQLTLVARNLNKVEKVAADLRVRSPQSTINVLEGNFIDPQAIQSLVHSLCAGKPIDIVLIAHGNLPKQDECQKNLSLANEALTINGISPALFAEAFAVQMEQANHGTLAVISSVAGDRGRKSNYVYGAAKGLLTRYVQGLQHRLAKTRVKVVLIKPGPTMTPMTAGLDNQQGFALVDDVAKQIVKGISAQQTVIYAPIKWMLIMAIIRHLPAFIFNKMEI